MVHDVARPSVDAGRREHTIKHGYGGESDQPVWLTLGLGEHGCNVIYEDCAPPYNPFASGESSNTRADLADRPQGGFGIALLMELSSSRKYERRGDHNVIELQVPRSFTP